MIAHHFSLGGLIVDAIQQSAPGFAWVDTALSMADVIEQAQVAPAARVIFGGEAVDGAQSVQRKLPIVIRQRWQVVIVVRNVANMKSQRPLMDSSGALIDQTLSALKGVILTSGVSPMQWQGIDPTPSNAPVGLGIYTLNFELSVHN